MTMATDAENKRVREAVLRETEGLRAEVVELNRQNLELRTALAKLRMEVAANETAGRIS